MRAMRMTTVGRPLAAMLCDDPDPAPNEVRLRVRACGVCRTDLHVVDGELPPQRDHVVPGHQIVGVVDAIGSEVSKIAIGDRLGVPWLGGACGVCRYCLAGRENLCDAPTFTGWTRDGGFSDTVTARADYCIRLPESLSDSDAAPLLCAGLIGFRAWRMACEPSAGIRLGLYGFGAAAHLLAQLAIHHGQDVFAFTKPDDAGAQMLAHELGVNWVGGSHERPPALLDAAIIFAPDGSLVPRALKSIAKGGVVVCGGIHMSDIPTFPYDLLWGERRLLSVANLTRSDAAEYFPLAVEAGVHSRVHAYPLLQANEALSDLRRGAFAGAAVLVP